MAFLGEVFTGKPDRVLTGTPDDYGNIWLEEYNPNTVCRLVGGYYTATDPPPSASYLNVWTGGPRPTEHRGVFMIPSNVGSPSGPAGAGLHIWGQRPGTGNKISMHCNIAPTRITITGTDSTPFSPRPLTLFQSGSNSSYIGGQTLQRDTPYLVVASIPAGSTSATINLTRVSDGVKFLTNHVATDTRWLGANNADLPGAHPVWETIRKDEGTSRVKWLSVRATVGTSPPGNTPPTVNAGADATANVGVNVIRTAVASDPDGGALTYQWLKTADAPVTFSGSTTSATVNFSATAPGVYTITCRVTDVAGATAADSLQFTVNDTASGVGPTVGIIRIR